MSNKEMGQSCFSEIPKNSTHDKKKYIKNYLHRLTDSECVPIGSLGDPWVQSEVSFLVASATFHLSCRCLSWFVEF